MARPTIVFVPGSWHGPECFQPLMDELAGHGFKTTAIALPSNTLDTHAPPATLSDDTAEVRKAIEAELEVGNDVCLIAHSYGAVPASNACRSLGRDARAASGQKAAVVSFVVMTGPLVFPGISFAGDFGNKPSPIHNIQYPFTKVGEPGPGYWFYHDLPAEEAIKWSRRVMTSSWKVCEETITHAAFLEIPTWYLLTTLDNAIPLGVQKYFVQRARDKGALLPESHVVEVASGHCPFLSQIDATSAFTRKAAGEV